MTHRKGPNTEEKLAKSLITIIDFHTHGTSSYTEQKRWLKKRLDDKYQLNLTLSWSRFPQLSGPNKHTRGPASSVQVCATGQMVLKSGVQRQQCVSCLLWRNKGFHMVLLSEPRGLTTCQSSRRSATKERNQPPCDEHLKTLQPSPQKSAILRRVEPHHIWACNRSYLEFEKTNLPKKKTLT